MNTKEIFRYEDASLDTPDEELLAVHKKLYKISHPISRHVYNVEEFRCLCTCLNGVFLA